MTYRINYYFCAVLITKRFFNSMKRIFLTVSVIAALAVSCNQTNTTQTTETATTETEMANQSTTMAEEVSYVGTYQGTLPCADCGGNHITLTIEKDSYTSQEKSNKGSFEDKGTVAYNAEKGILTLTSSANADTKSLYRVKEGSIVMLDQEGKEITTELAADYILKKTAN